MSVELESRVAHFERLTEELSGVVAEQGRTVDALTREVRRLADRLADLEYTLQGPPDGKPPPHY